jgi:hypothetical protein
VHARCNSVRAAREQKNVLGESVRRSLTCRTAPRLRQKLDETHQMSRPAVPLDGTHTFAVESIEGEIVMSVEVVLRALGPEWGESGSVTQSRCVRRANTSNLASKSTK